MYRLYDQKGSGTLTLSNTGSITILVNDSGDGLQYQYSDDDEIKEAEIEYLEDTDNRTGYADDEILQAAFTTDHGIVYFLGEFMRNDFGREIK
jgi:hypothetical protein